MNPKVTKPHDSILDMSLYKKNIKNSKNRVSSDISKCCGSELFYFCVPIGRFHPFQTAILKALPLSLSDQYQNICFTLIADFFCNCLCVKADSSSPNFNVMVSSIKLSQHYKFFSNIFGGKQVTSDALCVFLDISNFIRHYSRILYNELRPSS